jgi:putative hydroxymethylpyrimidine transport system substrate-binding protein
MTFIRVMLDGRWGAQREPDLIAGYARWLAGRGVLATADAWRGATTNQFLPESAVRAVSAP